ncbi:hypothetical protein HMPREF1487_09400 [Pseudomonas sp. HPB0071]|uniref:phospholipase D family nuclease n=1 Tax=unclassified Pseudomonas TaxID=196821 RepID=UPI0002C8BD65|nr:MULTISPECIES: phospholipase D family protein [unclassified Pseudomonas]ENA26921.1 hypothetical protein HMPREF1487_09400 [Pseudomonas sp. HPB0071]
MTLMNPRLKENFRRKASALIFALVPVMAPLVQASTPIPTASYEVGFSPKAGALPVILKGIDSARSEILVAAYSFTSKPISLALASAAKRGVAVRVIADKHSNTGKYTSVTYLANQGVPVRLTDKFAIMHNKYMVIDKRTVELGSFNYSSSADTRNAENALLLTNVPELANDYAMDWLRLWKTGEELAPNF